MVRMNQVIVCAMLSAVPLLTALPSKAEDVSSIEQEPRWFSCSVDSDCIAVEGPCARMGAVNAEHKVTYLAWVSEAKKKTECPMSNKKVEALNNPAHPYCRDKQCVVGEVLDVNSNGSEAVGKELPVPDAPMKELPLKQSTE